MTHKERQSLNALSASIDRFAGGHSKRSRDCLDIAAMAAGQFLEARARPARNFAPLEKDSEYCLQLSRIEARAQRLAARAARTG